MRYLPPDTNSKPNPYTVYRAVSDRKQQCNNIKQEFPIKQTSITFIASPLLFIDQRYFIRLLKI